MACFYSADEILEVKIPTIASNGVFQTNKESIHFVNSLSAGFKKRKKNHCSMNETKLLRTCLLVAALGIVSLFFLSKNLEAKEIEISLITPDYVGQALSVSGTVSKISSGDGMTFITLEDDGELFPVVVFHEIDDVSSGDKITVSGKMQEYKGRLQIVGEKYLYRDS